MKINTPPDIHKLVICANVFVVKDNKILMIKRSSKKTFFPCYVQPVGGKVDLNEDPFSAAKRELMEEAHIQVKNLLLKGIVTEIKSKKSNVYNTDWQIFQFVGEYNGGDIGTTEEGELMWLTLEEIKKEKLAKSIRMIIDKILDPNSQIVFAKYVYDENNEIMEKQIQIS